MQERKVLTSTAHTPRFTLASLLTSDALLSYSLLMAQQRFDQLQRSLANLAQRDIVRAARAAGWTVSTKRGKGSHALATKPGQRAVTIPAHRNTGTDREILKHLEKGAD